MLELPTEELPQQKPSQGRCFCYSSKRTEKLNIAVNHAKGYTFGALHDL